MSRPSSRIGTVAPSGVATPEEARSFGRGSIGGADIDRALVMRYFRGLVESGVAEWTVLQIGHVRLSFGSGAIFDLTPGGITRIA